MHRKICLHHQRLVPDHRVPDDVVVLLERAPIRFEAAREHDHRIIGRIDRGYATVDQSGAGGGIAEHRAVNELLGTFARRFSAQDFADERIVGSEALAHRREREGQHQLFKFGIERSVGRLEQAGDVGPLEHAPLGGMTDQGLR